jgi:hypothetical protein
MSDLDASEPEEKKRKVRQGTKKAKKTKVERLYDSHNRKSARAAVAVLESATQQYESSTLTEAIDEANAAADECTEAATQADSKALREKFERLARLFGANSARCTAVLRQASAPVTCVISSVAGNATAAIAAAKDRDKQIADLRAANGSLRSLSGSEHPTLALTVGSNGVAALTTSTTQMPKLPAASVTVDYLAFSIPRGDLAAQQLSSAGIQTAKNANRRLRREQQKNEMALRRSVALPQF